MRIATVLRVGAAGVVLGGGSLVVAGCDNDRPVTAPDAGLLSRGALLAKIKDKGRRVVFADRSVTPALVKNVMPGRASTPS